MNKYEQIKAMANPNRGSVGVQEARPAQRTEQEPVQFKCTVIDDVHPNGIPLEQWTPPPQRTEQLKACVYCGQLVAKEKNNGV